MYMYNNAVNYHLFVLFTIGDCHTYNLTVGAVGASGTAVSFTGMSECCRVVVNMVLPTTHLDMLNTMLV